MSKSKRKSMREKARERAERRKNSSGGGYSVVKTTGECEFFKPVNGENLIDILPYEVTVDNHPEVDKGDLWYERTFMMHRNIGVDDRSFICPRTIDQPCPICEERKKLMKTRDRKDPLVEALRPKERELFNIRVVDGDGEVQLWDVSTYLFGEALEEELRAQGEEVAMFAELEEGLSLKVRMKEDSFQRRKFLVTSRIDFVERDAQYDEAVLNDVQDLDQIMIILDYEQLKRIFLECDVEGSEKSDSDSDDETPKRRRRTRSKKDDSSEDDSSDSDDDSSDDDSDDSAAKEKPKRRRRTRWKPKSDDSDKEDDSGDDDSGDDSDKEDDSAKEKPKRRRRTRRKKKDDGDTKPTPKPTPKSAPKEPEETPEDTPECPFDGGVFGETCGDFVECEDCDLWEDCSKAQK